MGMNNFPPSLNQMGINNMPSQQHSDLFMNNESVIRPNNVNPIGNSFQPQMSNNSNMDFQFLNSNNSNSPPDQRPFQYSHQLMGINSHPPNLQQQPPSPLLQSQILGNNPIFSQQQNFFNEPQSFSNLSINPQNNPNNQSPPINSIRQPNVFDNPSFQNSQNNNPQNIPNRERDRTTPTYEQPIGNLLISII